MPYRVSLGRVAGGCGEGVNLLRNTQSNWLPSFIRFLPIACLEVNFHGWVGWLRRLCVGGGWVVGVSENKANTAKFKLNLGLA